MKVDEFVAWSERRPDGARHELVDGRPVEMRAERNRHALVEAETWRLPRDAVRAADLPCTVLPDGVTVAVEDSRARRPDVVMQCEGDVDPDALTCDAPLLLVEVDRLERGPRAVVERPVSGSSCRIRCARAGRGLSPPPRYSPASLARFAARSPASSWPRS